MPSDPLDVALPRADFPMLPNVRVVLARPRHPGNIGAVARAMKTMGLSDLALVAPERYPHPDAKARASGALDVLEAASVHASLADALAGCTLAVGLSARRREIVAEVLTPAQAAPRILAEAGLGHGSRGRVALVFGNETFGLSREELSACQWLMAIPSNPAYASLNLGSAVQVVAYELRRALEAGAPPVVQEDAGDYAGIDDVERFFRELERALIAIEFLDPATPKRLMPKLRRLFSRTRITREEMNILLGMAAAMNVSAGRQGSSDKALDPGESK
jgi:TrmH family RNA methyltransferase